MFSIFSDRRFLASESTPHAVILAPFWGTNPEPPPEAGRFDRYAEVGGSWLRLSSLATCDVGVFPQNWESAGERAAELAEAFTAECSAAGKTAVVFSGADATDPLPTEATVFRTSLVRSLRRSNEFALPAWSEDFLVRHLGGELRLRKRLSRPKVGFCGNPVLEPPRSVGARIARFVEKLDPWSRRRLPGKHPRALALRAVECDPRLDSNLILRDTFWAAAFGDTSSSMTARREYVRNMLESDYVLCVRGIGNFSYRLYETLSMGRIPIFVDTDCVLPLDFDIDWRDFCVWVDESEIDQLGDRVLEFHGSLSDAEFRERQQAARRLWETRISPQGFFASFPSHFDPTA